MGAQICPRIPKEKHLELNLLPKQQYKLHGPPHLFRPTPITKILINDDLIEREETPIKESQPINKNVQSDMNVTYLAQQSEEIDSNQQQKPWIKKNFAIEAINVSNFKNDENNNSFDNNQRHKPILKNKNGQECSNISISIGSQRSIKKVTFDKKQQVLYCKYKNS